jgi:type IV pilus assembly protein PilN
VKITLNLATRPFADIGPATKKLRIAMGVLALVSIALGFGLHLVHHAAEQARAREQSLDFSIARIEHERQSYTNLMHEPANAQLLAQSDALNQLFDAKSVSWTLVMEDLETVLPGGVQVTSIEPIRDKDGQITMHLRVKGPRDREVELVANLEHSKRFLSPRITGENAESDNAGPNQQLQPVTASSPFDFDLLAEYNPPTAGELNEAKKAAQRAGNASGDSNSSADPEQTDAPQPSQPRPRQSRAPYNGVSRPQAPARPGFPPRRPAIRPETSSAPQGGQP